MTGMSQRSVAARAWSARWKWAIIFVVAVCFWLMMDFHVSIADPFPAAPPIWEESLAPAPTPFAPTFQQIQLSNYGKTSDHDSDEFWPLPRSNHPLIRSSRFLSAHFQPFTNRFAVVDIGGTSLSPWFASPSIISSHGHYYCAYDMYSARLYSAGTVVAKSKDGVSWHKIALFPEGSWGTLFVWRSKVYIAYTADSDKFVIRRMDTLNDTIWTNPTILYQASEIHSHNGAVTVLNGTVYVAFKEGRRGGLVVGSTHSEFSLLKKSRWKFSIGAPDPVAQPLSLLRTNTGFPIIDFALSFLVNTARSGLQNIFGIEPRHTEEPTLYAVGNATDRRLVLRTSNSAMCSLAALYRVGKAGSRPTVSFERFTNIPGLGGAHPFIFFDDETGFYFMLSQFHRDAFRNVTETALYRHRWCGCETDRSAVGLYVSRNGVHNWELAAFVGYSVDWSHHFTYPHCTIDGRDLLCVMRAHIRTDLTEKSMNFGETDECDRTGCRGRSLTANNHNSNAITMHRIPNFRSFIDPVLWGTFENLGEFHLRRHSER